MPLHCVSADNTERSLADLDYIPTEKVFCESKYKRMVINIYKSLNNMLKTFSWLP